MTDIVERLLLKKTLETVEDVHVLFADAADEIERLREALQAIHKHQKRMPNIDVTIWELTRAALGEKE